MIEELKEILKTDDVHVSIGKILKLYNAQDRSYLKVLCETMPDERQIIATMTWDSVGPNSGHFRFPVVGDMVLIGFADGDNDMAYVLKRLTTKSNSIPELAKTGDDVNISVSGKKYWNISDTRINLSRSETQPTENLVLGQIFKKFAADMLEILKTHAQNDADHLHIGNIGYYTTVPNIASEYLLRKQGYDTLKTSPINDQKILSDLSFTEK